MPQSCSRCSRLNPAEAAFCWYDGSPLDGQSNRGGPVAVGSQRFHAPFVFPSGRSCGSFDELALACQQHWAEARDLLHQGALERFLGGLGRADLALAARQAARHPDRERGLDEFLDKLPSGALQPPQLRVEPPEINLGHIPAGQDRRLELRLLNEGMRLLHGSATCADCVWLSLGEGQGTPKKLFRFDHATLIPLHIRGQELRASTKPLEGHVVIVSNGGTHTVVVRAEVPPRPFPEGVLAGALSPRQVAEKAKAHPKEAAPFLENGMVARWYKENGWDYPIAGPPASGLGAVQQFFEALGLTSPPKVEIREKSVTLQGEPGETVRHTLEVQSQEKRPVYAHGTCEESWVEVERARLNGRTAAIPLRITVPGQPGETLRARIAITANGNQRFVVPLALVIGGTPCPTNEVVEDAAVELIEAAPTGITSVPLPPPRTASPLPPEDRPRRRWVHLMPLGLLGFCLLGIVTRDAFLHGHGSGPGEETADDLPRIAIRIHDGWKDVLDDHMKDPSMRFGLVMLREQDPNRPGKLKRLTYDEWGRTNNVCVRLDDTERLLGNPLGAERILGAAPGRWLERDVPRWEDELGREHEGMKSTWIWEDRKLAVTQLVEIVRGEQTNLLDTCLVRYILENQDASPHKVGFRFLLDTYIGANDGVPFIIPGAKDLCDTMQEFGKPEDVPDFIQALEFEDLAKPGTVAHLKLKLGGRIEGPSRMTLGAWPETDPNLKRLLGNNLAQGPNTLWQVPVISMKTLWPYDSVVVLYWPEQPLPPGGKRELGFAYGLGSVSSGGRLLVTAEGSFKPGGTITVTALVREPLAEETLTLTLPTGFQVEGLAEQKVPPLPANAPSRNSPVTWKVKVSPAALAPGAAGGVGQHTITVQSSTGVSQNRRVTIRSSSIFD